MYMGGSDKRVPLDVLSTEPTLINSQAFANMKYSYFSSQLIAASTAKVYHPIIWSASPSDKISIINLILILKS